MNFDWKSEYTKINTGFSTKDARPVIAITGNYDKETCMLAEGYYQSVLKAGGIPMIIPPFYETDRLGELLDRVDGIIFSGGGDPNPLLFGEEPVKELHGITPERDMQELLLVKLAYDRQIPMLGICKGIQMINAALGGTLFQDIHSQVKDENGNSVRLIKHSQDQDRRYPSHTVHIDEDSILGKIYGTTLCVNSFHHQACKEPAPCLRVVATAADGIIEAIESNEHKSILGVQWHPEPYVLRNDTEMLPIFEWLIGEASEFKTAKNIHKKIVTLDSHCDTPMFFHENIDFGSRDPRILVDLHKMTEGHLDATIMVAYLQQQNRDEESLLNATAKANQILSQIEDMVAKNCTAVDIAKTPLDIVRLKAQGKKAIMMGIENGYAIGKDIKNVEAFRNRGVVYMTLCHNGDNDICDAASRSNNTHGGVSEFGERVIHRMNDLGIMVDLSHGGEKSFYNAIEISRLPIVCSHSNCRVLCDHQRNLTDDQLRALARKGGVAHTTFYHGFLKKEGEASILDGISHLEHAIKVMGIEHVGIGTDFDGDGGVAGMSDASDMINFTMHLLRKRFSDEDIRLIWGGNWLRVMQQVQQSRV